MCGCDPNPTYGCINRAGNIGKRIMDFPLTESHNGAAPAELSQPESPFPNKIFMTNKPAHGRPKPEKPAADETEQQRFDRVLGLTQFKPLKAILDSLRLDGALLRGALATTNSYPDFLGKLGYRLVQVQQIHENDCYARLGPKGGIRAVHPYHDTDSYNTFVTLVNFDGTVTTTPNAVGVFSTRLAEFKTQLLN
jgi:hypothetical protein